MPYQSSDILALREKHTSALEIRQSVLTDTQWQSVIEAISMNAAITELTLENLALNDDEITELACVLSGQTTLTHLRLSDNSITHVGLRKLQPIIQENKNLTHLVLGGNVLGEEGAKILATALAQHTNLIEFGCWSNHFQSAGLKTLLSVLAKNPNIMMLNLSDGGFNYDDLATLASTIQSYRHLQQLILWNMQLGIDGLKLFLPILISNQQTLRDIRLGRCYFGIEGLRLLAPVLQAHQHWQVIELDYNYLGRDGGELLAKALDGNKGIKRLSLSGNRFGFEGSQQIFQLITNNTDLEALNYADNDIRDEGAEALANIFKDRTNLLEINLSYNLINAQGLQHWVPVLKNNRELIILEFSGNNIGAKGVSYLANGLTNSTKLQKIRLADCLLNDVAMKTLALFLTKQTQLAQLQIAVNLFRMDGVQALVDALKQHTSLEHIWMYSNHLNVMAVMMLAPVLSNNLGLRTVALGINNVQIEGLSILASALQNLRRLEKLSLPHFFGPDTGRVIAPILAKNLQLTYLKIDYAPLSNDGLAMVTTALQHHRQLTELYLNSNHLDAQSMAMLVPVLVTNQNIHSLELVSNRIGPLGMQALMPAIARLPLQTLALGSCRLGAMGARFLAHALRNKLNLKNLYLSGNQFNAGFDGFDELLPVIRQNPYLQQLLISDNHLRAHTIVKLADALTQHKLLFQLHINNNPIQTIDNTNIEPLEPILQQNKFINSLHLGGLSLSLSDMRIVTNNIRHYRFLTFLKLTSTPNGNSWIASLDTALNETTSLVTIDVRYCGITTNNIQSIFNIFKRNLELKELILDSIRIENNNMVVLDQVLEHHNNLHGIYLYFTGLSSEVGLQPLLNITRRNPRIRAINISNNPLGNNATDVLVDIFNSIQSLTHVLFGDNELGDGYTEIIRTLSRHHQLHTISFRNDVLPVTANITNALHDLSTSQLNLIYFRMLGLTLTEDSLNAILPLFSGPAFESLELHKAKLTDTMLANLINAWKAISHAGYISLTNDDYSNSGVRQMLAALENNTQLGTVKMTSNQLTEELLSELVHLYQRNPTAVLNFGPDSDFSNSLLPKLTNFHSQPSNYLPIDYFDKNIYSLAWLNDSLTNESLPCETMERTQTLFPTLTTVASRYSFFNHTTTTAIMPMMSTTPSINSTMLFVVGLVSFILGGLLTLCLGAGISYVRKQTNQTKEHEDTIELGELSGGVHQYDIIPSNRHQPQYQSPIPNDEKNQEDNYMRGSGLEQQNQGMAEIYSLT